jgi:hypothetical protein
MRSATLRPYLTLALLAWFAQLCLPVVHAAMMAAPRAQMGVWCGEPARAQAIVAALPAEIREALELDGVSVDHLVSCAKLCATGAAPATVAVAANEVLRTAGLEAAPPALPTPRSREQAATPPSQGPPARA